MTTRRRARGSDPLASVSEIREVIGDLRRRCPELAPVSERNLIRLMNAVVVFQIKCRNFSFLLLKSISSASKLRQ